MDVDSWLGVLLVVSCALVLALTAAVSASGLFASRRSSRYPSGRGATRPDDVRQFVHVRERQVSSLVLARTMCIITGSVTAAALVMRHAGTTARPALASIVVGVISAGLLEATPRVVVSQNADRWSTALGRLTRAIQGALFVPAYLLDLPGRALLHLAPFHPRLPDEEDEEEIVRLVELEESEGGIEEDERQMIRAVFELEETTAREIMVPRIDITAVEGSATLQKVAALIAERGYSRIPLYEESIDNIVGVIYAKDVLARFAQGDHEADLRSIARPPVYVPESKRVDELLAELRAQRIHMAIVVDEYGGTSGLVTIEDLLEEIVGEIEDEYDRVEPSVVHTGEGDAVVDAREHVEILKELFDVEVESGDFDTVGGYIIHRLGKIPATGDAVEVDGLQLRVLSVAGRRIRKVRITRLQSAPLGHGSA